MNLKQFANKARQAIAGRGGTKRQDNAEPGTTKENARDAGEHSGSRRPAASRDTPTQADRQDPPIGGS